MKRRSIFPPEPKQKQSNPTSFAMQCARFLYQLVSTKKNVRVRVSLKAWEAEFRSLLGEFPKDRVKAALRWYKKNIGGEYVPDCQSAKTFRRKFPAIEAAMQRDHSHDPIKVSKEAKQYAKEVETNGWPLSSLPQLEQSIERSIRNCNRIQERLQELEKEYRPFSHYSRQWKHPDEWRFAGYIEKVMQTIGGPCFVIRLWYRELLEEKAFLGNPKKWTFAVDHDKFVDKLGELARFNSGSNAVALRLLEELKR